MIKKYSYAILMSFLSFILSGQEADISETIRNIAEELSANDTDYENAAIFTEYLNSLYENPVRINSTDKNEVSRLFFLDDLQIKALIDYTTKTEGLVSIHELEVIKGFNKHITGMMKPFITFENESQVTGNSHKTRGKFISNAIIKPQTKDNSYAGSQWKLLSKYSISSGNITGGFTFEKDAGEKLINGTPPLPDFASAYIQYSGKQIIRKFIAGDFGVRFGLGTNVNTSFRTGFLANATTYMPARNEIKPYTSSDENNFFRGVAAEFALRDIGLTLFCSHHPVDATIEWSKDSSELFISNFYKSGLHNTASLLAKKDAVQETVTGINISYNLDNHRIGIGWSYDRLALPFGSTNDSPEYLFRLNNRMNSIFSLSYNSLLKQILLYGEISANDLNNAAVTQGITIRPSDRLNMNFLFRHYSPGFTAFHNNGPGRNPSAANEKGMTANFTFEAAKYLFISAACDFSIFPWLKYRSDFPSMAKRYEIRMKYSPDESLNIDISYLMNSVEKNESGATGIAGIEKNVSRTVKIQAKFSPYNNLTLASRLDYKYVNPSFSQGTLFLQDIIYNTGRGRFALWFRYCLFNTDDWDSRLYTYENDLLHSFSIPALSGKGSRTYLMIRWALWKNSEFRVKYGLSSLSLSDYSNNVKSELKIQFRLWH